MTRPTISDVREARERFDLRLAHEDLCHFVQTCMVDEAGQPFVLADFQREILHLLCTVKRLVLMKAIEHGGSTLVALYLLWRIGRDPSLRCLFASRTALPQGGKFVGFLRANIEGNPRLRDLFHLTPASPWGELAICVQRPVFARDPTLAASGIDSPSFGSRIDILVGDDCTDVLSELSPAVRRATVDKFDSTLLTRVGPGGQVIVLGVPHHPEDLLHVLAARPGWQSVTYSAISEDGQPIWPARWPRTRLEAARAELGERRFAQMLLCRLPRETSGAVFKTGDLAAARQRGARESIPGGVADLLPGDRVAIGVDVATSTEGDADRSAIVATVRRADGTFVAAEVLSGRWPSGELVARIVDAAHRWGAPVIVEANGPGAPVAEWARSMDPTISVWAVPTTVQSKFSGTVSIFGLAASFERAAWVVPAGADDLLRGLADWRVGEHVADLAMALWIGWRWIALECGFTDGPATVHVYEIDLNTGQRIEPEPSEPRTPFALPEPEPQEPARTAQELCEEDDDEWAARMGFLPRGELL